MATPSFQSPRAGWCSQCGAKLDGRSNFCVGCGKPIALTSSSVLTPSPHHVAARGFAQTFGVHPAVAFLTIIVDLMMNFGTAATLGALWVATIPVGLVLGTIAYLAQKKWYGDDNESAFIKALIVALLTAIPAPVSPVLIPSGIVGFFRRKKT